jgi:FkbM family methyltransferase
LTLRSLTPRPAGRAANVALAPVGLALDRLGSISVRDTLERARRLGLAPGTVIDVGAAYGNWSAMAQRIFPEARFLLVEPLQEFEAALATRPELDGATRVMAAAGEAGGSLELYVHDDLLGTSELPEAAGASSGGCRRTVPAGALDDLVREHGAPPPYLLKVDVQGAEETVLRGAADMLAKADMVILEASFFPFFEGGLQFHEVVASMHGRGFVVYDLAEPLYRPLDGALAQADVAFVPVASHLRAEVVYASPEQRRARAEDFRRLHGWRLHAYRARRRVSRR